MTQVDWLETDLAELHRLVQENPAYFSGLGDSSDPVRQNYHTVAAEFFWRSFYLASAAHKLLTVGLRGPLIVLQRSLFECTISAMYLRQSVDPAREALIFRACSHFREIHLVPSTSERIAQLRAVLDAMPKDVVEIAEERHDGRGWTGKTWMKLGEAVGFTDYSVYSYLADYSHARIGTHVQIEPAPDGGRQASFGERFPDDEREFAANFSRRMLFLSFDTLRQAVGWEQISMNTSDPMKWLEAQP